MNDIHDAMKAEWPALVEVMSLHVVLVGPGSLMLKLPIAIQVSSL